MPEKFRRDVVPNDEWSVLPVIRRLVMLYFAAIIGGVTGGFLGGSFGLFLSIQLTRGFGGLEYVVGGFLIGATVLGIVFPWLAWKYLD